MALRLRRRCVDEQIVAEVMRETYLAVWRAAGAFAGASVGGTATGRPWTIAARRLADAFRRRAHHAEPPSAAAPPMFAWLSSSFFAPPATSAPMRVATWLLLPPGTPAGTWTALLLLAAGTAAYACAGPRW
ncbi:hypothetical protein [Streptomyces mirabilis]|uniref:hypothetical protein n=1 Tax=Streptomyces mirabilis TaxID=68239 RepID=UPI0033198D5A